MKRLQTAWTLADPRPAKRRPRGFAGQFDKRELERTVRVRALIFARWSGLYGLTREAAASRIGLVPGTLGAWQELWHENHLEVEPRGRPADRASRDIRDTIIAIFQLMGPGVGLPTLQAMFPEVARRELEDLLCRYRNVHRRRKSMLVHVLRWRRAGFVWAMDFTQPPVPVDGTYPKVLAVRDLSSGSALMALPVEHATERTVRDALRALFVEWGPPVVLKSDNDSAFTAEEAQRFLREWGVIQLLSPPGTPEYNGACEAGIGALKTRAHHESARNDRPGEWTCDDVEGARLMANQTARPWGAKGMTPDQAWSYRRIISADERAEFWERVTELGEDVRREQGYLPGLDLGPAAKASVERVSISRALVELGVLEFRRRRIPLPISRALEANIS